VILTRTNAETSKHMKSLNLIVSRCVAALLAGCSGGAMSGSAPIPASGVPTTQSLTVRMTISGPSGASASSSSRSPQFVSSSTNGVLAQAYSDGGYSTLIASNAIDVSSGSSACGGTTGFPRTCSVTIGVTAGTYWFKFTNYDAAPVGGAFAGAQVLGSGTVPDFTVVSGVNNQLSIFISGVISSLGVSNAAHSSLPADGSTHTVGLVLAPTDADGNAIGTSNAPYANPITVTLTESGGSGHASLSLNGGVATSSITSTLASDSIVLKYDGGGAAGYSDSIAIAATGAATQTLRVSPFYVTSSSSLLSADALNFDASGQAATLQLTEANAPGTVTYTATPSGGCTGVLTLGSVTGSGAAADVTASNGATLSASGCTITLADSLGTLTQLNVAATNTGTGGSVTIPGAGISTEFSSGITSSARPQGITTGPDGNLWFTELTGNLIGRITPSGVVTEFSSGMSAGAFLYDIASGPDGNLWFTEEYGNSIGRITPNGTVTEFSEGISANAFPDGIVAGPDGNLWFTEEQGSRIGRITPSGTVTEFSSGVNVNDNPWGIAVGPDGNLWFTEYCGSRIGQITPSGAVTQFSAGITPNANPTSIVAGPDGNLWFTESGSNSIGRITLGGTVTEFSSGITANSIPYGIVAGPDGNLWFTEEQGDRIGRITPSGAVTELSTGITANADPVGIASGPDGNLWFTELLGNRIGRITP
jgi:streptogramin lyase